LIASRIQLAHLEPRIAQEERAHKFLMLHLKRRENWKEIWEWDDNIEMDLKDTSFGFTLNSSIITHVQKRNF
jgi:hypothetical protein